MERKTDEKSKKRTRKKAPEGFMSRNAHALLIGGLAVVMVIVAIIVFAFRGYGGDDRPWIYLP